ncbi:MAG: tetratricopeptide repeat protein [Planctomycetaceae bacterium]
MLRILPLTIAIGLLGNIAGCSAGKALVMGSPARKHSPSDQLAHVADAYAARGDYRTAAEVYNQALTLSPGDRRLQRELAEVQRLARDPQTEVDPFRQLRQESPAIAASRRSEFQSEQTALRTVSAPAPSRLQQLAKRSVQTPVEEPADWNRQDTELDGFTDEELVGMESPLR